MPAFTLLVLAALFAVTYALYRRDLRRAVDRLAAGSRIAQTACGPIEYAVAGEGPVVLVVHGAGGGYDQGLELGESLVRGGFRVIAMSRFGYLRTPLPADASPAAQADAHAFLLDALNVERVRLVGVSAGGPSTLQFALRHAERVTSVVLMVPAAYSPRPGSSSRVDERRGIPFYMDMALRSDFLFWAAMKVARQTMVRAILGTPPPVVKNAAADERERVQRMLEQILPVSARREGLINETKVVSSLPRYELENITAPTLVISAEDDLYGTYRGARYSAEHIPGARFIGFPTGGHLLVGHQQELGSEISAFLR
jgi:pimeloyl-ACP methyl ester carboxylesterase